MRARAAVAHVSSLVLVASSLGLVASAIAPPAPVEAAPPPSFVSEFQPEVPTKFGGRSISVSINASNTDQVIVATESGGLFKSLDDGANWTHLDSFPLHRMSDVKWAPNNASLIIATAWASGDSVNPGGIWRSTNGGTTWSRVPSPAGCPADFNGWGIDFEPSSTVVYAGSDCGILVSTNGGASFTRTSTGFGGGWVHAVVARGGATPSVDVCSDAGHSRYTRVGTTLTLVTGPTAFPAVGPGATTGGCPQVNGGVAPSAHDLAGAPQNGNVLFVVKGGTSTTACGGSVATPAGVNYLFESDNAGVTWTQIGGGCGARAPWVQATRSSDGNANHIDVYFSGGLDTYRIIGCDLAALPCTAPAVGSPNVGVGHVDPSTVAFIPDGTNCARFYVGDGGVERSADCGANFAMVAGSGASNGNFNGLQVYELAGQIHTANSDYVFGTQDNSIYGSSDSGATWPNVHCCEGWNFTEKTKNLAGPTGKVTFTRCGACLNRSADTNMTNVVNWPNAPGTALGADVGTPFLLAPTTNTYVQWTANAGTPANSDLYLSTNSGGAWGSPVFTLNGPASLMGPMVTAGPASDPTIYQPICNGGSCGFIAPTNGQLLKITGVNTGGTVTGTVLAGGLGTLGAYNYGNGSFQIQKAALGVDQNDPLHLIAADLSDNTMKESTDGGASWVADAQLTSLVTAGGRFAFSTSRLGTQAHLIYFDPWNPGRIFVGTEDAGIIVSLDNGATWSSLPGSQQIPAITSFFSDDVQDQIIVSSYGRGLWLMSVPEADLAITKTHRPDPAIAGEELYYDITVTNNGPDDATNVTVVDTLPAEVTYVTNTLNPPATCSAVGQVVTCLLGSLASGDSISFTIKVAVHSDAVATTGPTGITNTAVVSQLGADDPDTSNNTASDTVIVEDSADLEVNKLCKPDTTIPAGQPMTCTVFVDNHGPSDARGVVLDDVILSNGAFNITNIAVSPGPTVCGTSAVTGGQKITCQLGIIPAASTTQTGRVTLTYDITAAEGQDIDNLATVRSDTPDPDDTNNKDELNLTITSMADLALSKAAPPTATAGGAITWTLFVTNNGPSTATNVVITDTVPAGVVLTGVVMPGASCNLGVAGDPTQPTICTFGSLAPLAVSSTMTINATVLPQTTGELHNNARVSSDVFDPNSSNDLATTTTTVSATAALTLQKTDSPDPVAAGALLTYTLTVGNSGPSTAVDVVVIDPIPAQTTFVSANGTGGTTCFELQPGVVQCDVGDLDPGESVTIFITVRVNEDVPDGTVLTDCARAVSPTDPASPIESCADTTVQARADLWIDKQGTAPAGNPAGALIYLITVHNSPGFVPDDTPTSGLGGPSDALNVVVTDRLPLDSKKVVVQFLSPSCSYSKPTHTVTCSIANLPYGTNVTFQIQIQVKGSNGTLTNTATVASSTTDTNLANNSDTVNNVVQGGTGGTKKPR